MAEWIKRTRSTYMLRTSDSLQMKGYIQTESEGTEKDIPSKWKPKESWSTYTYIRQNRL